jgi:exosortase/archaeosortase family protein
VKRLTRSQQANALLGSLFLALWPAWLQLVRRVTDGSDQPYGLLALASLLYLGRRCKGGRQNWIPATVFLLLYAMVLPSAPFLISGALGMLALGFAMSARAGTRTQPGLLGLALLSLPLLASLQFYLGYPLRVVIAHLSKFFLTPTGREISVSGTALEWGSHLVSVDAPCSGVQMLWTSLFLVSFLAAREYWSVGKTLRIASLSVGIVILGNALRAASLFLVVTAPIEVPDGLHESLGLGAFALVAISVVWVATRDTDNNPVPASQGSRGQVWFLMTCLLACLAGFAPSDRSAPTNVPFPGWPEKFEGQPLQPLLLSEDEKRFAEGFPGQVGRFHDGRREIIIRWVWSPSRMLHPASDCLKGVGYTVEPGPLVGSPPWSSFQAVRKGKAIRVREQIVDKDGLTFPDPSAWYWAAVMGRSQGPWWSYSVAESAQDRERTNDG